jgi:hypothetical protein
MSVHTMRPMPGQRSGGPAYPSAPPVNSWGPAPGPVRQPGPANPLPQPGVVNPWAGSPMAAPPGLAPAAGWPNSTAGQRGTSRRTWVLLGAGAVIVTVALIALLTSSGRINPPDSNPGVGLEQ